MVEPSMLTQIRDNRIPK